MKQTSVLLLFVLASAGAAFGQTSYPYAITTLAGSNPLGDGGQAKSAWLELPTAVAVDSNRNVYIADGNGPEIRKVTTDGMINVVVAGYSASSVQVDPAGNVYFTSGSAVYKASPAGKVTTIAGGVSGYFGDGGPATLAELASPSGLALDGAGNIYIADTNNCRVREITADGKIQTITGNGTCGASGDKGPASSARVAYPTSVAVDSSGNIYIAESFRIRKIAVGSGIITTIAGGPPSSKSTADGIQATNAYIPPSLSVAVDRSGNVYFTDYTSGRVRMIASDGTVTTVAGNGTSGFGGDGGLATSTSLNYPSGVAFDSTGSVYICDEYNNRIRVVDTWGLINTVAGATHYAGDQGQAASALLQRPQHAITDRAGNLYISDSYNHAIRKVAPSGKITTIAGNGTCGYTGDHGPALSATLCYPQALALDSNGNLYIADGANYVVRRIDAGGMITTYAGNGEYGDSGDGGKATAAQFRRPFGLAADGAGNLYVADAGSNRVHKVAADGTISLVAGTGVLGYLGDGGPATAAQLAYPFHLALDESGSKLYIADEGNSVVRKVEGGTITTVAGTPTCCGTAPDATDTYIGTPGGIAVDSSGNLYISEPGYSYVAKVSGNTITRIAGNGTPTLAGDGGVATSASVNNPAGLWVDAAGDVYVADFNNDRIRKLTVDSPASLALASGDQQTGTVGTTLKALMVSVGFRALVPAAGIPVAFAVTSGAATLTASTANTDATGAAAVGVTLGNTAGPVVVAAIVTGLPPVQFHLTANAAAPVPTISSGGITGAGGSVPPITQISPGGLASIYGSNFAPAGTSRQVSGGDLVNGNLPTQLAGVCVQVGGLPAFITYVGANQINIQVPAVPVNSTVDVQVISNCGTPNALQGATQKVATAAATPEFLYWVHNANGRNAVCAVDAVGGGDIGLAGLIPGVTFTPAKPGELVTIYGTGFGATNPAVAPGTLPAGAAQTTANPIVMVGGTQLGSSDILYAGVSPCCAGLYQLNIRVPAMSDGDYFVNLYMGSVVTPTGAILSVRN